MSTSGKNPFQRWFQEYKQRSNVARRRRLATRRAAGFEQMQFVAADAEFLEDRIVLDATLDFHELKLVAVGGDAKFQSRDVNEKPKNLEGMTALVDSANFPLSGTGRVISTTNRVEVYDKATNTKLFTLPEGGLFREYDWSAAYVKSLPGGQSVPPTSQRYADIVPRFGQVVMEAVIPGSQLAQRQTLSLQFNNSFFNRFSLNYDGQSTDVIDSGASAVDVQNALQKLSNIGGAGGTVTVSNGETAENRLNFVVTFGGTLSGSAKSISVVPSGPWGTVSGGSSSVTEYAVTTRDKTADNNGNGILIPLSGVASLPGTFNAIPTMPVLSSASLPSFLRNNYGYWQIPEDRATTVPTDKASYFTPTELGAYKLPGANTGFEMRLLGKFSYSAFTASFFEGSINGSKQLGYLNGATGDTSGIRVVKGPSGFSLIQGDDRNQLNVVPRDKDEAGNPQPTVFQLSGMNFELLSTLDNVQLDRAANKVRLTSGSGTVKAKASFNGGTLTVDLSGLEIDLATQKVTASGVRLVLMELGGYKLTRTEIRTDPSVPRNSKEYGRNGFDLKYDPSANRFTMTANAQFISEYYTAFDPKKPNPKQSKVIYLRGDQSLPNPVNLYIDGGSFSITNGVLDSNIALTVKRIDLQRKYSVNGENREETQVINRDGTGLFASLKVDPVLNEDKSIRIPGNSVVIYGQGKDLLNKGGVSINGTADFGGVNSGQFLISSTQFASLTATFKDFNVGGVKFKPEAVGSSPAVTASYFAPVKNEQPAWMFRGGASVLSGTSAIQAETKVTFGGSSTAGIDVFVTENRATGSAAVIGDFKAGQSSLTSITGRDGVVLTLNPSNPTLEMSGKATLKVNGFEAALDEYTKFLPGNDLTAWQFIESPNGRFVARVENTPGISLTFVVLDKANNFAQVWTAGGNGDYVSMQTDGNLVRKGFPDSGISNTNGNPGAFLALYNDGNLGVVHPDGRVLWQTNVHIRTAPGSTAPPGVRVSFALPKGVTGGTVNRLDGEAVNMYVDEKVLMNGLGLTPFGSSRPLRIEARSGSSTFTGDLSTQIADRNFFATANPINFGTGAVPNEGFTLDFTKVPNASTDWAVGGILMSGLRTATFTENNTKLTMNYPKSVFEKLTMADGGSGSEPNKIILTKGKITSAEITSTSTVKVGDFEFSNYKSVYNFAVTPPAWVFNGPAKFFGKDVNVGGGPKEPNLKIGGDPKNPKRGPQILPSNLPYDVGPRSLPLPNVVVIDGMNFDTSKFPKVSVDTEGQSGQPPKSKTYTISNQDREYTVNLGQTKITFTGAMQVKVFPDPNDENKATYSVVSFAASIKGNTEITIGNATLKVNTLDLAYDTKDKQLKISGDATFIYKAAGGDANITVKLGDKEKPGLVIRDGAVQSLVMTVSGDFNILKLNIKSEGLTLEYQKEQQQFVMYGSIVLNTAKQGGTQFIKDMKIKLGVNADRPGLVIASGSLKWIDISLSGDINLFGITATPENLRVRYSSDTSLLQITGGLSVTLANRMVLRAALPGQGIIINTQTGEVQIRGIRLSAQGDIKFGVVTIKNLEGFFEDDGNGNTSFGAAATISLPSGLEVGGSFKVINGKLDSIGIKFQRNPGILVANGLINIYSIEGSVEGLSDLENNFKIKATVRATVGPKVAFAGQSFALADVTGSIEVTTKYLEISGDVKLVGGLFGSGTFTGRLTWGGTPNVHFNADIKLFPGDVIRGVIDAYVDINGNVDFSARIGVFVPRQIPVAGGAKLGSLSIELRVRPAEPPSNSYVSFSLKVLNATGKIKANFDANVRFDLEISFFFFSIHAGGDFRLRDISSRPEVQIQSAGAIPGTPDGRIIFASTNGDLTGQIVDLYADTDATGNDGTLIGSGIPVGTGNTTWVWQDMSTYAKPGQPVYVYAVVRDSQDQKAYSDYSLPFSVSSGFVPAITAPSTVGIEPGQVTTFSVANGNAILIDDPRKRLYADSEVLVALDSGGGTLDFPTVPSNVVVTGAGTRHMTLRGKQDNINAILNGLTYASSENAMFDDTLTVSVDSLPLENLGRTVQKTISLNLNPVTLSTAAYQDSDFISSNTVMTGDEGATPLEIVDIDSTSSDFLTGARIRIENYEAGSDLLDFSFNSELESDIDGSFDAETGVLTLSGFESIEAYEAALANVVFSTRSATHGKSLTVSVLDEDGEKGQMTVPLRIVRSHTAPQIQVEDTGILYTQDQDAVFVVPSAGLAAFDGQQVINVAVEFSHDSYTPGEDVLGYVGSSGPITGSFNATDGILTLSGAGTTADFAAALRKVFYESKGASFTPGTRYVTITVTDSEFDNNKSSLLQVIQKSERSTNIASPVLTLGTERLEIQPSEDYVLVDENLRLTGDLERLTEARVAITDGYCPGEQTLAAAVLFEGMSAEFDEFTGELIIQGVATVEEYREALRGVVFLNTAADRTCHSLTISYSVTDGVTNAATATLSVSIADAPYLDTQLDNVLVYENGRQSLVIDTGMAISYDGNLTGATVQFVGGQEVGEDRLAFWNQNGITGTYRPRLGVLELTGTATVAQYEAAIESIRYHNTRYNPSAGDRIIEYQVRNGSIVSNKVQALISVDPNLLSPRITLGSGSTIFQEDGQAVRVAPNFDLAAMDETETFASAPAALHGVEVAILNYAEGEDLLEFVDTAEINGEWNSEEGILFLYGDASLAAYETAVRSVTYRNTSDAPSVEARQIRISLLDNGENGMSRNTVTTQIVRSSTDSPLRDGGDATPVYAVQNGETDDLGLGDLSYRPPGTFTEDDVKLIVRVTEVPGELLGSIVTASGKTVSVNDQFPVSDLASLHFESALGGRGYGYFKFAVHLSDPNSGRLDQGFVSESVTIVVAGVDTTTSSEAFIAQALRDLTGRDPASGVVTNWSKVLDQQLLLAAQNGTDVDTVRQNVISWLTRSNAVRTAMIQQAYRSLLGRVPSTSELTTGLASLKAGKSLDDLKLSIAASEEYFTAHGATNASYVEALFEQLRGEDGSSEEKARWIKALEQGQSQLSVAAGVADFEDAVHRHSSEMFDQLLNREPGFKDRDANQFDTLDSLMLHILSSDEYFGRNAVPTSASRIRTQPTNGYSAVGKLGDISGDKATGTLIAPQYVLVAAHSVADLPPGQLTFTVGGVTHHVSKAWVHPSYDFGNAGKDNANDIAILKLDSPVTGVAPAVISTVGVKEGDVLNLVGYGEHEGSEYGTKRTGSTPVVEDVGSQTFQWTTHTAWENDSDPGDSGAPLFLKQNGVEYLAGIVSGGTSVEDGFGDTSLNMRVDTFADWIRTITGTSSAAAFTVNSSAPKHTEGNAGQSSFQFTVTRSGRTDTTASVAWNVIIGGDRSADASDFGGTLPAGRVDFAPGESSKVITVPIAGDGVWESDETFTVSLSNPTNGAQIAVSSVQGMIKNDDSLIDLSYSSVDQAINVRVLPSGALEVQIGNVVQPAVVPSNVRSLVIQGSTRIDRMDLTGLKKSAYPNLQRIELYGNEGNDTILGSDEFSETISGGLGSDTLRGGTSGGDRLSEMATAESASALQISLTNSRMTGSLGTDVISGFEEAVLSGTGFDDILNASGFSGPVNLSGLAGNDLLVGGSGDDLLFGGADNDQLNGGPGNDVLVGGDGDDLLNSGDGHNVLVGGYGKDRLNGGRGQDLLISGALIGSTGTSAGLNAIRAEWTSNKTITTRRANLKAGVGTNGLASISSATVLRDGSSDELQGGTDRDWFVQSAGDVLFDHQPSLGDLLDIL